MDETLTTEGQSDALRQVTFIELAEQALTRQNPRFALYRSQDPTFRQSEVEFWANEFRQIYNSK